MIIFGYRRGDYIEPYCNLYLCCEFIKKGKDNQFIMLLFSATYYRYLLRGYRV
jgi:hypothetical protein